MLGHSTCELVICVAQASSLGSSHWGPNTVVLASAKRFEKIRMPTHFDFTSGGKAKQGPVPQAPRSVQHRGQLFAAKENGWPVA